MSMFPISLKRDLVMSNPYQGRGIPSRWRTFPAGTMVHYSTVDLNDGVTRVHTASIKSEGSIWQAYVRTQIGETR